MGLNFQDVIRDVHDQGNHQLRTSASLSASTVYIGTPTLFAVVNTSASEVSQSIVTVANLPLSVQIVGNSTVSMPGGATVYQGTSPWDTTVKGNLTLSDAKTYIGLITATVGNAPILGEGVANIGFASVTPIKAWPDPSAFIGLVTVVQSSIARSVSGNITVSVPGGVTVFQGTTPWVGLTTTTIANSLSLTGNLTLSDAKTYIGLVTATEAPYTPTALIHGIVSAASGSLVQFPSNAVKYTIIKASFGNPTTAYVGGATATISNGFHLDPGDSVSLAVSNTNLVYLVGVGTAEVRFIGGN